MKKMKKEMTRALLGMGILCVASMQAGMAAMATDEFETGVMADGYYVIASAMDSGKMLRSVDGVAEDNTQIEIWDDTDISNELYYIERQQDGFYKIINAQSEKSLQVRDGSAESGVELHQKTYDASDGQRWNIKKTEDGYYTIESALGTVVDCAGGNSENGNRILMCDENGGMNQKWILYKNGVSCDDKIRNGVYAIASEMDVNKELCISNGSEEEDTPVVIWDNQQYENESFYIEEQEDGTYKIASVVSDKSLSVRDGSTESGAKLEMKTYDATDAQKWNIVPTEDRGYYIQSALSTYIDCSNASTENGNEILLCDLNGNDNQKWELLPQGMVMGTIGNSAEQSTAEGTGEAVTPINENTELPETIASGLYVLTSAMDGNKALHIVGDSMEEGATLEITDNVNSGFQTFFIGNNEDGTYKISCDAAGGFSLDVKDASAESGAILQMRAYDGTQGEVWKIYLSDDKQHYCIQSSLGTNLDCAEASTENGTAVTMFEATGAVNQQWNLQRVG